MQRGGVRVKSGRSTRPIGRPLQSSRQDTMVGGNRVVAGEMVRNGQIQDML